MLFVGRQVLLRGIGLAVNLAGSLVCQAQSDPFSSGKAPFFLSLHVGGGLGLVAVGGGVQLAQQRLEPEVLVGYVPRRFSSKPLTIFTFKATYLPVRATLGDHWRVSGGVGGYVSYTHGATIRDSKDPSNYTPGYYFFSTKVRTGLFVTPRLTYAGIATVQRPNPARVAAYAELGTNDLYLLSRLPNKGGISVSDILTLGFGSKVGW
ncbi:hypothetical protein J0X19_24650 [Hymenobacter sp. BT186]|uniref:Uncharacterized protein n=1 Tax=Hymenobacter telluris TaxID=2816474 RepID=A0A939F1T1_9BACT|nr:hypothetical protein [Hymenobacter telluris]MBO0361171.1 hypothetical protein [Hymenobacter telluris]MBW3377199.1 hypothetical protein [Hymenobacter norwichensis]